jgi:hypothetical protein
MESETGNTAPLMLTTAPPTRLPSVWRSIFGWKALFRWDVLGAIVPGILIAAGFGMLSLDWFPANNLVGQICFALAGLLCVAKTIGHAVEHTGSKIDRSVFAVIICTVILGIDSLFIWNIEKHKKPIEQTANQALTVDDLRRELKGSKESKMVITSTELVFDKAEDTNEKEVFFNVKYQNGGDITATEIFHDVKYIATNLPPAPGVVEARQDVVLKGLVSNGLSNPMELAPASTGDLGAFFSVPLQDSPEAKKLAQMVDSDPQNLRIYLLITFRYRDAALPNNKMRIAETCGYFMQGTEYFCGRRRTFVIDWPASTPQ